MAAGDAVAGGVGNSRCDSDIGQLLVAQPRTAFGGLLPVYGGGSGVSPGVLLGLGSAHRRWRSEPTGRAQDQTGGGLHDRLRFG
ncbi:hypothetical protein MTX35_24665, partial [Rhodococcus sp. ARC_M12]